MTGKIILILLFCFTSLQLPGFSALVIDQPLEAAIYHFPTPPIMRCLYHSGIPLSLRKADIYKRVNIPGQLQVEQKISVSPYGASKFNLSGSLTREKETKPFLIKASSFFDTKKDKKSKPTFLFGLEDLIGVQRKIHVNDRVGNQDIDYVSFLRVSEGKIGNSKFQLELFGQDRVVNNKIKYFLQGKGKIGELDISVSGAEVEKDTYEVYENYGNAEVFTRIKVYN